MVSESHDREGLAVDLAASGPSTAEKLVAGLACTALGASLTLVPGVTPGLLVAVLLLPVWAGALWRPLAGRWYALFGLAAVVSGLLLTWWQDVGHATDSTLLRAHLLAVVTLVSTVGVIVWARRILADRDVALLYALGFLAVALTRSGADNPWKFQLSVAVTMLVLALCMRRNSRLLDFAGTVALALVSVLNDSRSLAAMLLMVASLIAWQGMRSSVRLRSSAIGTVVQLAFVALTIYWAMQAMLLEGYLGESAQERTQMQIDATGSLIVGGRPEMGATLALLQANPLGVGAGTLVNLPDLNVARSGMESLNYNTTDNGYVENFMFGFGYEVHSFLGDFWLRYGIAGVALAVTGVAVMVLWIVRRIASNTAPALYLYLVTTSVWDFLFSPVFYSSVGTLALAVGLALADAPRSRSAGQGEPRVHSRRSAPSYGSHRLGSEP
jgi:hypothetical protein